MIRRRHAPQGPPTRSTHAYVRGSRWWRVILGCLLPLVALGAVDAWTPPHLVGQQYDFVIRGGTVIDGTGSAGRVTDVGIRGNRVITVGDLGTAEATRVIDAAGLHVVPGFIDTHSHATWGLVRDDLRTAHALLAQGVTTILANPDGGGPADMAAQREQLTSPGVGVNVAQFVPHGAVRREVLGMQAREATPEELERMRVIVRQGMDEGAFGLSSGLYYSPGSYAPTGEVVELAKVAAEYGGAYQSHIRDESDYNIGVIGAVDEVIEIARAAGVPGVITHIKALGPRVWGSSAEIVEHIESAREEGLEIYADQYPYEASGTSIVGALVPRWALAGGDESFAARLGDRDERARLVTDMWDNLDRRGGAERLVFQGGENGGKSLADVAAARGADPIETAIALLEEGGPTGLTSFNMEDEDIHHFMEQPWMMTSSDGILNALDEGHPHPRDFGAFPRKIRKYVVEDEIISLERAVYSMSGLPASVFKLPGRGVLATNAFADVVVFDLEEFRDLATYDDPNHLSEGVQYAFVNGVLAVDDGRFTDALAGEVLRKPR
ncbi:MAG: D-aminoacylase [Gemmatimonadota bacterium]|nr:D-aminoacylase [Gemmatimonadota bacterium]